jgi:ABC-type nitrate/sulfonate/bicarbonate transport system substrate-binding protein
LVVGRFSIHPNFNSNDKTELEETMIPRPQRPETLQRRRECSHPGGHRAAIAVALTALIAAAAPAWAAEPAEPASLSVAVFAANAAFAHVYLGESEGYFKKEGVSVTLQSNTGSNTLNVVVSGQTDLGMIGAGAPLLAAKEGKPTSIIYAHVGNANGGTVVARSGFNTLDAIKNVGATGIGSSSYGFCNYYKQTKQTQWNVVVLQDVPTMLAALKSGRIDGACNNVANFRPLIDSKEVHIVVDTRDPAAREKYLGKDYPEAAIFGITSNLQTKRPAVIAFMKAVGAADKFLHTQSARAVAESLHKLSVFSTIPVEAIEMQVTDNKPYFSPNAGYISPAVWEFAITQYNTWGLAVDPKDSTFAYDKRVDMSYYDAALGKPTGAR